ncbi:MAG: hypothetical protein AAFP86_17290, partial [Planctomycetota bacterium]
MTTSPPARQPARPASQKGPRPRTVALAVAAALTACSSPPPAPRPWTAPDLVHTDRIRPARLLAATAAATPAAEYAGGEDAA